MLTIVTAGSEWYRQDCGMCSTVKFKLDGSETYHFYWDDRCDYHKPELRT